MGTPLDGQLRADLGDASALRESPTKVQRTAFGDEVVNPEVKRDGAFRAAWRDAVSRRGKHLDLLDLVTAGLVGVLCLVAISSNPPPVRADVGDDGGFSIVFPIIAPRVSSSYGTRIHPIRKFSRFHRGVDLAAPENSHVRAVVEGRVVFAGTYAGFGKLVTVQHGRGFTSLYAHLAEISVNVGDKIPAGAIIGRVGSTGLATGPHLHFEWRRNGVAVDPLKAFPSLAELADG